ncbi:MAG: glycosyltransferase [Candidatus Thermoplasmatota archaeon]|nr:glycosyltransferase [Candidatus Thermoplasmatota archaeon]
MLVNVMGEVGRRGGGQAYMKDMILSLHDSFKVSLITDATNDPFGILHCVDKLVSVSYSYKENQNILKEILQVRRLRHQLNNINLEKGLTINNHPNIFLKKGDFNILHGFSFLDFIINENGKIKNKLLFEIIKWSRIYKIYDLADFIANSTYTKDLAGPLFRRLGISPNTIEVLYPTFRSDFVLSRKENGILSFQRINKEKKLETILEVARKYNGHFVIAGAVNDGDQEYYKKLIREKTKNVDILPNPTEEEKRNLFLNSKIFLHTNKKEHFGISIVEAMSHGLVPVVPKSGGPWVDIIERGKFGFGYSDNEELLQALDEARKTSEVFQKQISESTARFSFDQFRSRLNALVVRKSNTSV